MNRLFQNHLAFAGLLTVAQSLFAASTVQFPTRTQLTVAEDAGQVEIPVVRIEELETIVSVEYYTIGATATADEDFASVSGMLNFAAGETNQTIVVPILNDGLSEAQERFQVVLTNVTGEAVLGSTRIRTINIRDNDKGLQLELASYGENEDAGKITLRILRQDDGDYPVSVVYATTNVTALAGEDYVDMANTASFASGEFLKYITVPLLNDSLTEPAETFRIVLSDVTGRVALGTPAAATVTITDTDDFVEFGTASVMIREDAVFARLAVVRGESGLATTVGIATDNGTAIAGQDFTGVTNTISFEPGLRLKHVDVPLLNDGDKESSETFQITLSEPTGGAVLGPKRSVTVTILDNDPGVGFERGTNSVWETQDGLKLKVIRGSDGWLGPFTVDYQTVDGTAQAGVNYEATSGTVSFATNEMLKEIPIVLLQDPSSEPARSFTLTLGNVTEEVPLGQSTCQVTIVNGSQGNVEFVQPTMRGEIGREADLVEVSWTGSAALSRADAVTGPWEQLGTVDSPLLAATSLPGGFFQLQSPRSARLYVPSSYDGQTPTPLVMVLHGYGGDAADYVDYFRIEPLAEARGFLVCHPDGTRDPQGWRFWNATDACCDFYDSSVDDSMYLRGLIEEVARQYVVDGKRIYVTGHSNGGYMSYRMAYDHADLIAGIASLAGLTFLDSDTPRPSQPVHVLQIHGTADEVVPYDGGAVMGGLPVIAFSPGAIATVQAWAGFNGCQGPVWAEDPSMDLDLGVPGLDTTVMHYTEAPAGGAVELWRINGGSHGPALNSGSVTSEYSSRVIDWLLAHPKP